MRAVRLLALLAAVLAAVAPAPAAAFTNALDFYFLIDQSGSIKDNDSDCEAAFGLSCMNVLADFANRTATRMAELVGSFYESPENNGIRIGIAMFRCKKDGKFPDPKIILDPTGNVTEIEYGFEKLFKQRANGYTCAETALSGAENWIAEQESIAPPVRKTSILYMTDGFLDDSSRSKTIAERIREPNTTQIFGISIGDRRKQREAIAEITGDPSLIFDVDNVNALSNIIDKLTAFIFGDFRASLRAGTDATEVCQGDTPVVQVTGSSVSSLQALECEFELEGFGPLEQPIQGTKISANEWECSMPESFYSDADGETVIVTMFAPDDPTDPDSTRRKIGQPTEFVLARKACLSLESNPSESRCIGDTTTFTIFGRTLDAFVNSSVSSNSYSFTCRFDMGQVGANTSSFSVDLPAAIAADGTSISCTVDDKSISKISEVDSDSQLQVDLPDGSSSQLDIVLPTEIIAISVIVEVLTDGATIPGTNNRSVLVERLPAPDVRLDLESPTCFKVDFAPTACWRQPEDAPTKFSGSVVAHAASAVSVEPGLELVCVFADGNATSAFVQPVTIANGGKASCAMPDNFLEPRANGLASSRVHVDLFLLDTASSRALQLSDTFDTANLFTLKSCLLLAAEREACFGDSVTINIESTRSVPLLPVEDTGLSCMFSSDLGGVEVQGQLLSDPNSAANAYECQSPDLVGEYFGLAFSEVSVFAGEHLLQSLSLTAGSENPSCFEPFVRPSETETWRAVGDRSRKFDVEVCWGWEVPSSSEGPALLFTGTTPEKLKDEQVICRFTGGAPALPDGFLAETDATFLEEELSPGFSCPVPAEIFSSGTGGRTNDLLAELVVFPDPDAITRPTSAIVAKQRMRLRVNTQDPCLDTTVVLHNASLPRCLGVALDLVVSGQNADILITHLGNSDTVDCVFDSGETAQGTVDRQAEEIICPMPKFSLLPSGAVSNVTINQVVTVFPPDNYAEGIEGEECIKPVIVVDEQTDGRRRRLQTGGSNYCLGDGLSAQIGGPAVAFLLAELGIDDVVCEWTTGSSATHPNLPFLPSEPSLVYTSALSLDGSTVGCVSPTWNPYSAEALLQGVYAQVQVRVNSTSDPIGQPVDFLGDYQASVCSEVGWGEVGEADQDCQRNEVEVLLAGRTAVTLKNPPAAALPLNCWGDEQPLMCELTDATTGNVTQQLPEVSGTTISCVGAGWDPELGGGNYSRIELLVCMDHSSPQVVKAESFSPTAGRSCLTLDHQPLACPGDEIEVALSGATLSSYVAWAIRNGHDPILEASCTDEDGDEYNTDGTSTEAIRCNLDDGFDPALAQPSIEFSISGLVVRKLSALDVSIHPPGEGNCVFAVGSRVCVMPGVGSFVQVTGPVVTNNATVDRISCELFNDELFENIEATIIDQDTVECASNSSEFTHFRILYDDDFQLSEPGGTLLEPGPQCDTLRPTSAPSIPGQGGGGAGSPTPGNGGNEKDSLGVILGVVFATLLLVLLAIFFVVRKRHRGENSPVADIEEGTYAPPKETKSVPVVAEEGPAEPLLHNFAAGDRVEAHGTFQPEVQGGFAAWYKGTIAADNDDGTFTVQMDHLVARGVESTNVTVTARDMRPPLTDFPVGENVEARFGGGPSWHAAHIDSVGPNNTYGVSYDEEGLADEVSVSGELIRPARMIHVVGAPVEALRDKRYLRAKVVSVDVNSERYGVQFQLPLLANGGEPPRSAVSDGPEEPDTNDVDIVAANLVRPFVPVVGETLEVGLASERRARVLYVEEEDRSCVLEGLEDKEHYSEPFSNVFRPVFFVGQRVKALRAPPVDANQWMPAEILAVESSPSGNEATGPTFTIKPLHSEEPESGVPMSRVRIGDDTEAGTVPAVGDQVQVKTSSVAVPSVSWEKAKIGNAHDDGTYDVAYESGPFIGVTEARVPIDRLRNVAEGDEEEEVVEEEIPEPAVELDAVNLLASPMATEEPEFRPPPREHPDAAEDDGLQVPFHLRFRKRRPLEFMELPDNKFEVTLDMSEGLGLSLGWTNDNRVIVAGFRDLSNGDWGPVEACGLVGLKDQLLAVNDHSVAGKSFVEVSDLIRNSDKEIKLQFGRWTDDEAVTMGAGTKPPLASAS